MFEKKSCGGYKEVLPGIRQKTLVHGGKTAIEVFSPVQEDYLPSQGA